MRSTLGRLAPAVLLWLLAAGTLVAYDTSWTAVLRYSLFLGLGVVGPGILLWRWLRGNVDGFAADAAFGAALGHGIAALVYIPSRAVGVPLLALAFPVLTIGVFAAVPGLRRHWRSPVEPMPPWWSWAVAGTVAAGVAVAARFALAVEPLRFDRAAYQYVDMPFHLAIAAELKHHMPGQIPYVSGEPLHYHWFAHATAATASWQSGIELDVLFRRLLPMSTCLLVVFGLAVLATRLSGRAWSGPVAGALLLLVGGFDVFGWNGPGAQSEEGWVSGVLVHSPSQPAAVLASIPVVWLIADLLRGRTGRRWGTWVLFVVGLLALTGMKATFVPMLLAATGLAMVVGLATTRKLNRAALVICLCTLGALAFAQFVLFGGSTQGTAIAPWRTYGAIAPRFGFAGDANRADAGAGALTVTALTLIASWCAIGAGMIGFARTRVWRDPAAIFVMGFLVAGIGAASLIYQHGYSQLYFVRSAIPIAAAAGAWGLTLLFPATTPARILLPRALGAVAGGVALSWLIGKLTTSPPPRDRGDGAIAWHVLWPWLTALLVIALVAVAIRYTPPRWRLRGSAVGLAVLVLLGCSALRTPYIVASQVTDPVCIGGANNPECEQRNRQVPFGGDLAARYIRAHSSPDDVLATNSHCVPEYEAKTCDPRNFWLSAYAERRVLLEGWAYTPRANLADSAVSALYGKYWDPKLRLSNDVVFNNPTSHNIGILRDTYGVRWLVFDKNVGKPPAELKRLLPKPLEVGAMVVYEVQAR